MVGYEHLWSVAIYSGNDLSSMRPLTGHGVKLFSSDSIHDLKASGIADPFIICNDNRYYMFCEVIDKSKKGQIGIAESEDGLRWEYRRIVVTEPFHLSYPYVFKFDNDFYMIPESQNDRSIRLYRATDFPFTWNFVTKLMTGFPYLDSSFFKFKGRCWLYTTLNNDTLLLYHSDNPAGPWLEHPKSPIVKHNKCIARSAGRVLILDDGSIIRFAQDCSSFYGKLVSAFKVTTLTTNDYREEALGLILKPGTFGWNRRGMHHIDAFRFEDGSWTAFVDGYRRHLRLSMH